MLARRALTAVISSLLICGCDALGIGTATVEGEWLLTARNLTDGHNVCSVQDMTLLLTQTRHRFSGTASNATVACVIADSSKTLALPVQPVVAGTVDGSDISFQIGGPDWQHNGKVAASAAMTGTMQVRFGPPMGATTFAGSFGAAKTADSVALR